MQPSIGYLEALQRRLVADECEVYSQFWNGRNVLVGKRADFRLRWMATRLHLFTFAVAVPVVTRVDLEQFTSWAQDFAIEQKGGMPRGAQSGVAVLPALVGDRIEPDAAAWAAAKQRVRFACLTRPVAVDTSRAAAYCFRRTAFLGLVYSGHLRRKLDCYFPSPTQLS